LRGQVEEVGEAGRQVSKILAAEKRCLFSSEGGKANKEITRSTKGGGRMTVYLLRKKSNGARENCRIGDLWDYSSPTGPRRTKFRKENSRKE